MGFCKEFAKKFVAAEQWPVISGQWPEKMALLHWHLTGH
jgi:hypothetical protein